MNPQLKVAYEALSKDATLWDSVGDALETAQSETRSIAMYRGAFSFAAMDVADDYATLHQRVIDLLGDGAKATHDGATALRTVRDDFEKLDDYQQAEIYSVWQPLL